MTLINANSLPDRPASARYVPVEELARHLGVEPLESADDLVVPG